MIRTPRIPIVGLVLSVACNHAGDGATGEVASTSTSTTGSFGGSETGMVITAEVPSGTTTTGALSTGETSTSGVATGPTSSGDPGTSTSGGVESSTSATPTTGLDCVDAIGDATNLQPPIDECDPEPCAADEICVRRIDCEFLPNICEYYGSDPYCYVEQDPWYCEPIPDVCNEDPETFEECIEGWEGGSECGFDCLCRYGGDLVDSLLFCDYVNDQCLEGMDFVPYCHELAP